MTSGERILAIIDYLKVSKNKFATKMLGLSASTKLDHIIKGRNDLTSEFAKEICTAVPQIKYEWLFKGQGEMLDEEVLIETPVNSLVIDGINIEDLANIILKYEDELMKIPRFSKMIERHALKMLNDKMPDMIARIYNLSRKS